MTNSEALFPLVISIVVLTLYVLFKLHEHFDNTTFVIETQCEAILNPDSTETGRYLCE